VIETIIACLGGAGEREAAPRVEGS
jgi:hypothetical protein